MGRSRPLATHTENSVKFGRAVFELRQQTNVHLAEGKGGKRGESN